MVQVAEPSKIISLDYRILYPKGGCNLALYWVQ